MLPHTSVDQRGLRAVGGLLEKIHAWQLGGKCQRTHRVHDEVDPEKL